MRAALTFLLLPLAASSNQPHFLLVACFSLFAAAFATLAFRVQPMAVFAGLAAVQSLTCCYFALMFAALLPLPLVQFALSMDWSSAGFFVLLSIHWLSLALFSSRPLPAPQAAAFFGRWLAYALISLLAVFGLGVLENYARSATVFASGSFHLVRQTSAGLAGGLLLVAGLILAYRSLRSRQALWFWLCTAALLAALAVILHYQISAPPVWQIGAVSASSILAICGLLADRSRFLKLESEVRRNLMGTVGHWESQAQQFAAALARSNEALLHLDLDERIGYASPALARLLQTNTDEFSGRPLKTVVPRHFYDAVVPALQDARRERSSYLQARLQLGAEEKVLQVSYAPLLNERQKVKGVHLGILDVTRHYQAETALSTAFAEKSRELRMFQQGVENATEAIAATDAHHRILFANDAFVRTTGLSRSEILGREAQQVREAKSFPWSEIKRRLAQNMPWRGEVSYLGRDGHSHTSELSVMPIADAEQSSFYYLWIERDLTARALSQRTEELQHRVQQMTKLLEISQDIRLNMGLEVILQSVANGVHTLGWQRVAVFRGGAQEQFELAASAGFSGNGASLPRKFLRLSYADFAPYLLESFRLSSSFFVDSRQLAEKRPQFIPKDLEVFEVGEWREHDCLLVPIHARDRYAGMIAVFCPSSGRRPTQQQVRELEVFADDAALAIENSRLLDLHDRNERQSRALNRIGNTFRAAGDLEQVLAGIAGILAEAMARPALIGIHAPSPAQGAIEANGKPRAGPTWLSACCLVARKGKGQPLTPSPDADSLLTRLAQGLMESELQTTTLASEDLQGLLRQPNGRPGQAAVQAKITALCSRQQNFGCVLWLFPLGDPEWSEDQLRFARDLAAQAALTIDNARLLQQSEKRADAQERVNEHIAAFLASVSHELRTPLHAILSFSEILLDEKPGALNREQKHQVKIVRDSGKNLLNLINDILDLSKIEAGKMEAAWQEFNPAEMIRETVTTLRTLCESKGLDLQLRLSSSLPKKFLSDRLMLTRVLTNLLGNAIKFTAAGEITVTADYQQRVLVLAVRDTGTGIPKERQQEIFEPFHQLESNEARRHAGTGLGLAISQRLIGILGGHIEVRSEVAGPERGSTFTVKLPIREASKTEPSKRRAKEPRQAPAPSNEKRPARPGLFSRWRFSAKKQNPAILVVEDDENTRYAMQFILEDAGYRVDFAENGEKALLAAQHERPDLILMDIMMPNLDGYQVARLLKAQKQLQHIPLVALTARAMKGDREKALSAGYDDYLTKPFEKKDLLNLITRWLGEGVEQKT